VVIYKTEMPVLPLAHTFLNFLANLALLSAMAILWAAICSASLAFLASSAALCSAAASL
jgi:hypothetical protein